MSYTIHTLIDITPTGKNRGRGEEGKSVDQQTNWLTFQNCAMLRTNMEFGEVTERGDRKPPNIVAKQGVLLVVDGKIQLIVAGLDRLSDLSMIADNYL